MSTHHFLYVPVDRDKASEMQESFGLDLSEAHGRVPDPARLRSDIDTLYSEYDGGSEATEGGFEARFTRCFGEHGVDGQGIGEYDDLTFEFSEADFKESNLVFLGRHLPSATHSLTAFLDLLQRHFGDFWIFDDAEMTLRGREEIMESSPQEPCVEGTNGNVLPHAPLAEYQAMLSRPEDAPPPACRACGRPVIKHRSDYDLFEQMHWICFHYENEHFTEDGHNDPDDECRDPDCPNGKIRRYEEKLRSLGSDPVNVAVEEHLAKLREEPPPACTDSEESGTGPISGS